MDDKTKGTIRSDGEIISSGVTPETTGTIRGTQPIISSGVVAPHPLAPHIVSSNMGSHPGEEIIRAVQAETEDISTDYTDCTD